MVKIIPHRITWRDDDISADTDLETFKRVHAHFRDVTHTIAVITEGLYKHRKLVTFINSQINIDVQLHCHSHSRDYTDRNMAEIAVDLEMGALWLLELFGVTASVLYPPHNKTSRELEEIAAKRDLQIKTEKLSLPQFTRVAGHVQEDIVNFHYWEKRDEKLLPKALEIYRKSGWDSH